MRRVILAFALCAAGCFIDPNKLADMTGGGGDGSVSGDGGGNGDLGDASVNNDNGAVTVEKSGAVVVAQFQTTATTGTSASPLHVVSAAFYDSVSTPCALTTTGACTVQKCANTAPVSNNNAGIITITGGMPGTSTLNPNGDTYTPVMMNTLYWTSSVSLSLTASGGDVPAFSTTVAAPALITVTNPAPPNQDMLGPPMSVPKASDLQLAWSGGAAGSDVEFSLGSLPGDYLVRCKYPAANGSGAIPAAILTQMANDGASTVRLTATSIGSSTVMAGEFKVAFLAINTASYGVTIDLE